MNNQNGEKIKIFRCLFHGLTDVYGSYDTQSGRSFQVKKPVTEKVILNHLLGKRPYGVYLLFNDRTRAITADFDTTNRLPPIEFQHSAKHYGIDAYLERSKSKGYHVWIFFKKKGVLAQKARLVVQHVLQEIEHPETEVFPKQDKLDGNSRFGNFINTPLFGSLVPKGKTVFIDPYTFEPYANQWELLNSVNRHDESLLDKIIEMNNLSNMPDQQYPKQVKPNLKVGSTFGLPPCAQLMLQNGVSQRQRCACFRLAVHLKRIGLPIDGTIALLVHWSHKNKPVDKSKTVITEKEIISQVSCAFERNYSSYGCESDEVKPYCQPECPVNIVRSKMPVHRQP
jgi:hypothetical protein